MKIANVGDDMEKRESSNTDGSNVNWYSHCGKQYGDFSIKLKKRCTIHGKKNEYLENPQKHRFLISVN